jgi:Iap family predicted aminopeptidase
MYPGATLVVASDESAAQSAKDAENGTAKVIYISNDPRDMVDEWYGDHLPKVFQRYDASTAPLPDLFRQAGVKDTDIAYSADKNGHTRIVELTTSSTGTKITIIRVDRPEDSDSNPPQP